MAFMMKIIAFVWLAVALSGCSTLNVQEAKNGEYLPMEALGGLSKPLDQSVKGKAVFVEFGDAAILTAKARAVFEQNGFKVTSDRDSADVVILFDGVRFDYWRDGEDKIIFPYASLVYEPDQVRLQQVLRQQKPGFQLRGDASAIFGSSGVAGVGGILETLVKRSEVFVDKTGPYNQRVGIWATIYVKDHGKSVETQKITAWSICRDGNVFHIKPDELYATAVDCLITCTK